MLIIMRKVFTCTYALYVRVHTLACHVCTCEACAYVCTHVAMYISAAYIGTEIAKD